MNSIELETDSERVERRPVVDVVQADREVMSTTPAAYLLLTSRVCSDVGANGTPHSCRVRRA